MMDQLESKGLCESYRLRHLQDLLAMPISTDEGVKTHWDRANDTLLKYVDHVFPWLAKEDENQSRRDSAAEMAKMWADTWGDPSDPETQRKIWNTVRSMTPDAVPPEWR